MGTVFLPPTVLPTLFATWAAYRLFNAPPDIPQTNGPWRPPQWQQPQLTSITVVVPKSKVSSSISFDGQVTDQSSTMETEQHVYFFDAVLRAQHHQQLRATEHPVQTGANIVDHAFKLPARVQLEVGFSDAMDRYASGSYTSNASKSISAYNTLLYLQSLRVPLTLTTRLNTYQNMLIESINAPDDYRTRFGLKALISFIQIITVDVATLTISARPDQSQATTEGTKQPEAVPETLAVSHQVTKPTSIPGAGNYSSNGFDPQILSVINKLH